MRPIYANGIAEDPTPGRGADPADGGEHRHVRLGSCSRRCRGSNAVELAPPGSCTASTSWTPVGPAALVMAKAPRGRRGQDSARGRCSAPRGCAAPSGCALTAGRRAGRRRSRRGAAFRRVHARRRAGPRSAISSRRAQILFPQVGTDLGQRLAAATAARCLAVQRGGRLLTVGTDLATLDAGHAEAALDDPRRRDRRHLRAGPSTAAYYLIGHCALHIRRCFALPTEAWGRPARARALSLAGGGRGWGCRWACSGGEAAEPRHAGGRPLPALAAPPRFQPGGPSARPCDEPEGPAGPLVVDRRAGARRGRGACPGLPTTSPKLHGRFEVGRRRTAGRVDGSVELAHAQRCPPRVVAAEGRRAPGSTRAPRRRGGRRSCSSTPTRRLPLRRIHIASLPRAPRVRTAVVGGNFALAVRRQRTASRGLAGGLVRRPAPVSGSTTGDSAIWARRGAFRGLGGYRDLAIMDRLTTSCDGSSGAAARACIARAGGDPRASRWQADRARTHDRLRGSWIPGWLYLAGRARPRG